MTEKTFKEEQNTTFSFDEDLVNLLNEVRNPIKDSAISYLQKKHGSNNEFMYASLGSVLKTVKEILPKYNFCLSQAIVQNEGKAIVQTRLIHKSGKWYTDGGVSLIAKNYNDPHQLGSSITYAKRYGLCSLLGLDAEFDDDATDYDDINTIHKHTNGTAHGI